MQAKILFWLCVPVLGGLTAHSIKSGNVCPPGFENLEGYCQPCKPHYFKNSTMAGGPCLECDYLKNQYQMQLCPCTSVRNAIIVCRDDGINASSSVCKRRSEVQMTCGELGGSQQIASTALSAIEVNLSAGNDFSGTQRPSLPITTADSVDDGRRNKIGATNIVLHIIIGILCTTAVSLGLALFIIFKRNNFCATGQKQKGGADAIGEQTVHPMMHGPNDDYKPTGTNLMERQPDHEDPHHDSTPNVNDDLEPMAELSLESVMTLYPSVNNQLMYECSVAMHTSDVSDVGANTRGVSSALG